MTSRPARFRTAREIWDSWTVLWNGDLTQATLLVADQFRAHAGNATVGDPDAIRTRNDLLDWIRQSHTTIPGLRFHTAGRPVGDEGLVAARWYATYRSHDGTTTKARLGVDVLTVLDGRVVAVWTVGGSRVLDPVHPIFDVTT
jgi:ketosteroid isomerase-like protein